MYSGVYQCLRSAESTSQLRPIVLSVHHLSGSPTQFFVDDPGLLSDVCCMHEQRIQRLHCTVLLTRAFNLPSFTQFLDIALVGVFLLLHWEDDEATAAPKHQEIAGLIATLYSFCS